MSLLRSAINIPQEYRVNLVRLTFDLRWFQRTVYDESLKTQLFRTNQKPAPSRASRGLLYLKASWGVQGVWFPVAAFVYTVFLMLN